LALFCCQTCLGPTGRSRKDVAGVLAFAGVPAGTSLDGTTSVADVSTARDPAVAAGPGVAGVPAVCVKTKVLSHQTTTNERNFICCVRLWNIEY
jgi:hypothetical protein